MVWTTAIVAFGTLFYAGAAVFQIYLLNESQKETTKQVDKLIAASERMANTAQTQANTATSQASSIAEQSNTMKESLGLTNRAVTAGEKQANTSQVSARAAEESVRVAQDTLAIGQRPWVLFQNMKSDEPIFIDGPFVITITIFNYGNSPAIDYKAIARMGFGNKIPDPIPSNDPDLVNDNPITLPPKQSSKIPLKATFSKSTIDRANAQRLDFYVWGRVEYRDIFNQRHYTIFCGYHEYVKRDDETYACKKGNYAN